MASANRSELTQHSARDQDGPVPAESPNIARASRGAGGCHGRCGFSATMCEAFQATSARPKVPFCVHQMDRTEGPLTVQNGGSGGGELFVVATSSSHQKARGRLGGLGVGCPVVLGGGVPCFGA